RSLTRGIGELLRLLDPGLSDLVRTPQLQAELAAINQQQLSLVDQLNALRQAQMRLDDEHNGIVTMRNQREDQGPEFGYLESLS
ncbi:hypothetical protein ACK3ZA_15535, partial [Aeromonas caviae]